MYKGLLVFAGSLSLGIGVLGIFVPGLPTTVFLLGAAACYVRSSDRLYDWLLQHRVLGTYINNYRKHKAMPLKSKVVALIMMWTMIGLSAGVFIGNNTVKLIVLLAGIIGTIAILMVKTLREQKK
jgi:uncharacterized membrane protein YbaN (DUF454 family)